MDDVMMLDCWIHSFGFCIVGIVQFITEIVLRSGELVSCCFDKSYNNN
jgi:hypothetical protein